MLILALVVAAPLQIETDSGFFANAFYHVACLGDAISCSTPNFERFWQEELGWDDSDDEALGEMKLILGAAGDDAPEAPPIPFPPNFHRYHPDAMAHWSLLSAVLESGSFTTVPTLLEHGPLPVDATRLSSAFGNFEARLRSWWEAQDRAWLEAHEQSVLREIDEANLGGLMGEMSAFLGARIPRIKLHFIRLPEGSKGSGATILDDHVFVKIGANDRPVDSVWKALHEITHVLYDRGPIDRHRKLVTQFIQAEAPHAMSLYTRLNEAIATALQLIVFDRLEIQKENFWTPLLSAIRRRGLSLSRDHMTQPPSAVAAAHSVVARTT